VLFRRAIFRTPHVKPSIIHAKIEEITLMNAREWIKHRRKLVTTS
jgi:hypothetical protein